MRRERNSRQSRRPPRAPSSKSRPSQRSIKTSPATWVLLFLIFQNFSEFFKNFSNNFLNETNFIWVFFSNFEKNKFNPFTRIASHTSSQALSNCAPAVSNGLWYEEHEIILLCLTSIQRLITHKILNEAASGNIVSILWQLMDAQVEEVRLLQTSMLLLTTTNFVHGATLSKCLVLCFRLHQSADHQVFSLYTSLHLTFFVFFSKTFNILFF